MGPPKSKIQRRGLITKALPPSHTDVNTQPLQATAGPIAEPPNRLVEIPQHAPENGNLFASSIEITQSPFQNRQVDRPDSQSTTFTEDSTPYRPPTIHMIGSIQDFARPIDHDQRSEMSRTSGSIRSVRQRKLENKHYRDAVLRANVMVRNNPLAAVNMLSDEINSLLKEKDTLSQELSDRGLSIAGLAEQVGQLRKDKADSAIIENAMESKIADLEAQLKSAQDLNDLREKHRDKEVTAREEELHFAKQQVQELKDQVDFLHEVIEDKEASIAKTGAMFKTLAASERALTTELYERHIMEPSVRTSQPESSIYSPEADRTGYGGNVFDKDDEPYILFENNREKGSPGERGNTLLSSPAGADDVPGKSEHTGEEGNTVLSEYSGGYSSHTPSNLTSEKDIPEPCKDDDENESPIDDEAPSEPDLLFEYLTKVVAARPDSVKIADDFPQSATTTTTPLQYKVPGFKAEIPSSPFSSNEGSSSSPIQPAELVKASGGFDESELNSLAMNWLKALPDEMERRPLSPSEEFQQHLEFTPVSFDVSHLSTTLRQPEPGSTNSSPPGDVFSSSSGMSKSQSSHSSPLNNRIPLSDHESSSTREESSGSEIAHIRPSSRTPETGVVQARSPTRSSAVSDEKTRSADTTTQYPSSSLDSAPEQMHYNLPMPLSERSVRPSSQQTAGSISTLASTIMSQRSTGTPRASGLMDEIADLMMLGKAGETISTRLKPRSPTKQHGRSSLGIRQKSQSPFEGLLDGIHLSLKPNGLKMHRVQAIEPRKSIGSEARSSGVHVSSPLQSRRRVEYVTQTDQPHLESQSSTEENIETTGTSIHKSSRIDQRVERPTSEILSSRANESRKNASSSTPLLPLPSSQSSHDLTSLQFPLVPFHPLVPLSVQLRMNLIPVRTSSSPLMNIRSRPLSWSEISTIPSPSFTRELFDTILERLENLFRGIEWRRMMGWGYIGLMAWLLVSTWLVRQQWMDGNSYMVRDAVLGYRDEEWGWGWIWGMRGLVQMTVDAVVKPEKTVYYA